MSDAEYDAAVERDAADHPPHPDDGYVPHPERPVGMDEFLDCMEDL